MRPHISVYSEGLWFFSHYESSSWFWENMGADFLALLLGRTGPQIPPATLPETLAHRCEPGQSPPGSETCK